MTKTIPSPRVISAASKARRTPKASAAQSVVKQAIAQSTEAKNVLLMQLTRIETVLDVDGECKLFAIFPRIGGGESYKYDLSFLLKHPGLYPMFADAFIAWGAKAAHATRHQQVVLLRNGFFAYLKSRYPLVVFRADDIDDGVLAGYREFLYARRVKGKRLRPTTINGYLGSMREMLATLQTEPWAKSALSIAERVPSGSSASDKWNEPTKILPLYHLVSIIAAAEKEVMSISANWERGRQLLTEGQVAIKDGDTDYKNVATCLAMLERSYPGVVPSIVDIFPDNHQLGYWTKEHGSKLISSYLYPKARDLVPFALLLTIATVFNPDTILTLKWSQIDRNKDRAGVIATEIIGQKGRASKDLVRLLDPKAGAGQDLSLGQLLDILERITLRLRCAAPPTYADRLFLYVPEIRAKRIRTFETKDGRSTNIPWIHGLANFITDNKLASFTLGQLRPTILDMIQMYDGGLEAARLVGNHGSAITTWKHYTSNAVKKRYRERIGEVILLRERWLDTNGQIDPRKLALDQDKGAATPGFLCLDPFDSPSPSQKAGTLCKDYGGCPSCPLAAATPSNAVSVAYYTALRKSIYASQPQMSARTWLDRWAPNLAALDNLLTFVPVDVLEESKKFHISLPYVG